jgi:hypothetical protein
LATIEEQTWLTMLSAADRRFEDAESLYREGGVHFAGAVYMYGYVVEMILKAAYFQADGYDSQDVVGELCKRPYALFSSAGDEVWTGRPHPLLGRSEKGHDLLAWFDALIRIRSVPIEPSTASIALNHTAQVASVWGTFRRYDSRLASVDDAKLVHNSVVWLNQNRATLWS